MAYDRDLNGIDDILAPLLARGDDDAEVHRYWHLDPEDEAALIDVIRDRLRPPFLARPPEDQADWLLSLRRALENPRYDLQRLLDSAMLPIETPADPRRFFVALWKVLCPDEEVPRPIT
jgi:hypothetical protein